jgi:DNA-binding beta-propeller fold protein YncE
MFLIGWDRLVTFHNDGVAGQVTITAEIHDSRLPYETGIENIGDESAAYSITESFDIEANETYVAVIEFGISLGGGSDSVRNTANRVCGANPVTGLFDSNCICTASNLSIRVLSDPIGLEFQTPELRETCGRSVQLQAIRLTDAPEPTPTPEPGLGILERVRTFTTLKRAENDRDPEPMGIAFSPDGNVYVAVDETHQVLIFDSSGGLQTTIGSGTRAFGSSDEGDLASPTDIAVDPEGNLFVSEPSNQRFQAFTKAGVQLFTKGEYGRDEGEFSEPRGIAISSDGEIYIADSGNGRIQVFDSSGEFLREWGSKGDAETEFGYPTGVAVSADGLVYVTDRNNDRVLVFTTDGTFKTSWQIMIRDQPAERPGGAIAIDPRGLLYTAANYDHDEYIIVTDLSGNYLDSWATPLLMIGGIAISPDYRALYVSDSMFARIEVLAINHQNIP